MINGDSEKLDSGRGRFNRYAPVILWIALIFYLSSSSGASANTSRFVRPLLEWLFPLASEDLLAIYHGYVRKCAHLFIYGGLTLLSYRAFVGSSIGWIGRLPYVWALGLVAVVGALDELNQSFNALRTGTASDILIDLLGGLLAGVLIILARAALGRVPEDSGLS